MIPAVYSPGASNALPKLFLELPGDECKAPRDSLRICKTEDLLFLAALLKRAGNAHYFLELADKSVLPESAGHDESERTEPAPVKSRIKQGTIRRRFRDEFFATRQALADAIPLLFVIEPEGKEMRKPRQWNPKDLWMIGKGLKWPFEKGHDPLLTNLHNIPLLSWQEKRPLKNAELYCPLDGPVIPIKHEWSSPQETWEQLCGRAWRVLLCPDCLGQFQVKLVAMN